MTEAQSRPSGPHDEETADENSPLVTTSRPRRRSSAHVRPNLSHRVKEFAKPLYSSNITSLLGSILMLIFCGFLILFMVREHKKLKDDEDSELESHLVKAWNGAVASDVDVCSQIGVDILRKKNGTAVDATIATALCIGVINMYASGIGGGGFMVIRHPNGTSHSINFREMAPGAAHKDMYNHDPMTAQIGGLAVGIPGEVAGFWKAWQMYGRVDWRELFEPSIRLCEEGFEVPYYLEKVMNYERKNLLQGDRKEWEFLFKNGSDDQFLEEGDTMKRPALAKTLRYIAENGPDGFYKGKIAKSLVDFVQSHGGILTTKDMGLYRPQVDETLKVWAFGQEILTCQPPCSGAVLIEGLNIVEGLDMSNDESGLVTHRIIETMKWLSAGRTELGDPSDSDVSNIARVAEIQSKQFAAMVRRNISDTRTYGWKHYNPSYEFKESKGTSHMSALDSEGMAVALTSTVNLYFGARICDPETGIVLNDQMDDFSIPGTDNAFRLQPSIYNYIKPYKRPLSSTAPTITVYNGYPSLIIGGSGGSKIVTSVFLCFIKVYKWGYELLDTIHSPRVHHQLIPEVAYVEDGVRDDIIQGLKERGHTVEEVPVIGSVIQAVYRQPDGEIHAVSDFWRKGGRAAGY